MVSNRRYIIGFVLAVLLLLTTYYPANAFDVHNYTTVTYPLNYQEVTQRLLIPRGKKTTSNDLYLLACVIRTHLKRKENIDSIFSIYPERHFIANQAQIELVKDVINNEANECYDLYIVLPLFMIDQNDSLDIVDAISNSLAFISYRTYIKLTVQPNL